MPTRPVELRAVLDAARIACDRRAADPATDPAAVACLGAVFAALDRIGDLTGAAPVSSPVVARHLAPTLDPGRFDDPDLASLARAITALAPLLRWAPRRGAEACFADAHANTMILGPGGLEQRDDVWIGATLMAPGTRYPDHSHPPEETYLVLSPGDFWHQGGDWVAPGIGGTYHNPPGILHAMRAGAAPLFALWMLRADPVTQPLHSPPNHGANRIGGSP